MLVIEMLIPLRGIIRYIMLPAPGETTPSATLQDFISQTAQRPYLRDDIRQFTDSIVNLNLTTFAMPFVHKVFHPGRCDKRIVDERIQFISMMDIDNLDAGF